MASEPRFYVLRNGDRGGPYDTAFLTAAGTESGDAPLCPECGRGIGMRELLHPVRIELEVYGTEPGDFARGTGDNPLVSARFMEAFRAEKLTGVAAFEPVELAKAVRKKAGPKLTNVPRYYLMKAQFGRAEVDEAQSRLRRTEPIACLECRNTGLDGIYGFRIQPATWEGLDVFRPRGLQSDVLVSERFADLVRRHGFTNIKLVHTEQFLWDPLHKGPPENTVLA